MNKYFTLLICLINLNLWGQEDVKDIVRKMFQRNTGKTYYANNTLISCQYKIMKKKGKSKKKCTSPPRKKVFESLYYEFQVKGIDKKSLSIITGPINERGMKFMQVDYIKDEKVSDQWMYLPALKKMKRIVSPQDSPRSGSFFGSEISYEDIEKHSVQDFTYQRNKDEVIDDKKAWVIEMTPTEEKSQKSSYAKSKHWIDQISYLALKSEYYSEKGKLVKTFYQKKIQQKKGVWLPLQTIVVSHEKSRMSMMKLNNVVINEKMDEGIFHQRSLKDESYLSQKMKNIRKKMD